MDQQQFAAQLFRELVNDPSKRTKIGLLREFFPLVEDALQRGVDRAAILEALAKLGLELQPRSFTELVSRVRKERRAAGAGNVALAAPVAAVTSPREPATANDSAGAQTPVHAAVGTGDRISAIARATPDIDAMQRSHVRRLRAEAATRRKADGASLDPAPSAALPSASG
ncbi:hypothetical protein HLB44_30860 [Aquincola sp. S2]|uniref:Uncharacterized protein n=1 Tax=Pseudaquabacterium terrae TaxID=2732868 RepID=A0ABX2ESB4_9BURK|nr:hypothetical protein [Aquabacterium terrae]NRF71395.1 hypothetical protein [Aquabacterium terrae]